MSKIDELRNIYKETVESVEQDWSKYKEECQGFAYSLTNEVFGYLGLEVHVSPTTTSSKGPGVEVCKPKIDFEDRTCKFEATLDLGIGDLVSRGNHKYYRTANIHLNLSIKKVNDYFEVTTESFGEMKIDPKDHDLEKFCERVFEKIKTEIKESVKQQVQQDKLRREFDIKV